MNKTKLSFYYKDSLTYVLEDQANKIRQEKPSTKYWLEDEKI